MFLTVEDGSVLRLVEGPVAAAAHRDGLVLAGAGLDLVTHGHPEGQAFALLQTHRHITLDPV